MSFDLTVDVTVAVSTEAVNGALAELGAPFRLDAPLEQQGGYLALALTWKGVELFTTGFELYPPGADGGGFALCLHEEDEPAAAWTFAAALAMAGRGTVTDPQSGKTWPSAKLDTLRRHAVRLAQKVEKAYARLPDAEKKFRARRRGESDDAFRERLFLRHAAPEQRAAWVKEKLAAALARANPDEREAQRLAALVPAQAQFLEPLLDPCFRAGRLALARTIAARFDPAVVRAHLTEAVGWVGAAAAPYAGFLVALTEARGDAAWLEQLRAKAATAQMRAALEWDGEAR